MTNLNKRHCRGPSSLTIQTVKTGTLPPTVAPSPFGDNDIGMRKIAELMNTPSTGSSQSQLRQLCLERDNFRCVATGTIDGSGAVYSTRLAHIIPLSFGKTGDALQVLTRHSVLFSKR